MPYGIPHPYQLDKSISNLGSLGSMFQFHLNFVKISTVANRVETDKKPCIVASNLVLHCVPLISTLDSVARFWNTMPSECQIAWNQIRPNAMPDLDL